MYLNDEIEKLTKGHPVEIDTWLAEQYKGKFNINITLPFILNLILQYVMH